MKIRHKVDKNWIIITQKPYYTPTSKIICRCTCMVIHHINRPIHKIDPKKDLPKILKCPSCNSTLPREIVLITYDIFIRLHKRLHNNENHT